MIYIWRKKKFFLSISEKRTIYRYPLHTSSHNFRFLRLKEHTSVCICLWLEFRWRHIVFRSKKSRIGYFSRLHFVYKGSQNAYLYLSLSYEKIFFPFYNNKNKEIIKGILYNLSWLFTRSSRSFVAINFDTGVIFHAFSMERYNFNDNSLLSTSIVCPVCVRAFVLRSRMCSFLITISASISHSSYAVPYNKKGDTLVYGDKQKFFSSTTYLTIRKKKKNNYIWYKRCVHACLCVCVYKCMYIC